MWHKVTRTFRLSTISLWMVSTFLVDPAFAQSGEAVYSRVADSIFLLQVRNASGESVGTGSAFLVTNDLLLTNAHVVAGGSVFVRMGPLEVPCKVEREDKVNDLALCRLQARTSVSPLAFASTQPSAGGRVFAVGNPKGLEKTITEGVVSGRRVIEGADMLQISASISPGSSGGPVLNLAGEVVGVVAGSLRTGQNLNFAVPLDIVRGFIDGKQPSSLPAQLVAEVQALHRVRNRLPYSSEADSEWVANEEKILRLLIQATESFKDPDLLASLYPVAEYRLRDAAVAIAQRVVSLRSPPAAEDSRRLARAAYYAAVEGAANEKALLADAERSIRRAIELAKPNTSEDFGLLGDIQKQQGRTADALVAYSSSNNLAKGDEERLAAVSRLFRANRQLGRNDEAYRWMTAARKFEVRPWDKETFADFLSDIGKYEESGLAYWELHLAGPTDHKWACEAGVKLWLADRLDDSLRANRKCLELGVLRQDASVDLGRAHQIMAGVLLERGVYEEAVAHAQNAIAIHPKDSFASYYLGRSYEKLRRFDDAVTALKNAIRVSDGKFGMMHFALGSAYFELKRWPEAAQAYEKAAELTPTDAAAAYNVAASYYNNREYQAALPWYREVLKRNPKHEDRAEILATIAKIGGGL